MVRPALDEASASSGSLKESEHVSAEERLLWLPEDVADTERVRGEIDQLRDSDPRSRLRIRVLVVAPLHGDAGWRHAAIRTQHRIRVILLSSAVRQQIGTAHGERDLP